jgi:low affinity Fe/Cu permease
MTAPLARHPIRPTQLSGEPPFFDRFAGKAALVAGRGPFFGLCVLVVAGWVPTVVWLGTDTWQLTIQTITAVVTFLLVALLQNRQSRADAAAQHKLNEIADAMANVISSMKIDDSRLRRDVQELKAAVGLEDRERS